MDRKKDRKAPLSQRAALAADARYGLAPALKRSLRHAFPDHWSFLLGEVALYSFVILVVTGIFLTLFFQPSLGEIIYHGGYHRLDGVKMSQAYESTIRISFDVRGGLLIRQIHHWAALLFVAAIAIHMLRIFFTGAFRKPREINWIIGVTMFALSAGEGFLGYSLPDDLLSGTGVRIADGVVLSVPVIGTYLSFFFFGGQYPGNAFVHRMYIMHVLLIPGLLAVLIGAHLFSIWHQGHTQWPGKRERDNTEVGVPMFPVFVAKTSALFLFTAAALTLAGGLIQINPIWLWGPYTPVSASMLSQPDWYIGFLEGSLRLMPGVESIVGGHTFAWDVFVPGMALPMGFFVLAAMYPFLEQAVTGDRRYHQVLDRPRNDPTRTAIGAAVVAQGVDLLLAGADDVISYQLHIPLYDLAWGLRTGFFVAPILAFIVTRRSCVALQRRDRRTLLARGVSTGRVTPRLDGGFGESIRALNEDEVAELETRRPAEITARIPRHVIPLPTPRRMRAQLLTRVNRLYMNFRLETPSSYGQPDGLPEFEKDGASPDGQRSPSPGSGGSHGPE